MSPKKTERISEKDLIVKKEKNEITPAEFVGNLEGDLKKYWSVIHQILKQKRVIRNKDLLPFAKKFGVTGRKREEKLNFLRGILNKFVEWKVISTFKHGTHLQYLCNLPNFYQAEELLKLIPNEEMSRMVRSLADGPKTSAMVEQETGSTVGIHIVEAILGYYVDKGVIQSLKQPKGAFKLTDAAKLTGTDPDSLLGLDLFKAENLLDKQEDQEAHKIEAKDTKTLGQLARADLESKTIVPQIVKVKGESAKIVTIGEVRLGNQFTDFDLLDFAEEQMKKDKPDVVVASGFVQGDHRSYQVERLSGLSALYPEEISRLSGRDYVAYYEKQWEKVQTYM